MMSMREISEYEIRKQDMLIFYGELLDKIVSHLRLVGINRVEFSIIDSIIDSYVGIIDEKVLSRLKKNIIKKCDIYSSKIMALEDFMNQGKHEISEKIKEAFGISEFKYKQRGGCLVLTVKKSLVGKFFKNPKIYNHSFGDIGFYIKENIPGMDFDIIIVTDSNLIEHELNESLYELFTDDNISKTSIFSENIPDGITDINFKRSIMSDIFLHLISLGDVENIKRDIKMYLVFLEMSVGRFENYSRQIISIIKEFEYIISLLSNFDFSNVTINRALLFALSYPERFKAFLLLTLSQDSFKSVDNFISSTLSDSDIKVRGFEKKIYELFANNRFDVRYCTMVRIGLKSVHVELIETKDENVLKKLVKTPLNVSNPNIVYVLDLYLKGLVDDKIISSFSGNLKDGYTLINNDGIKDGLIIDESGNICFQVIEKRTIVKTHKEETTTIKVIEIYDDYIDNYRKEGVEVIKFGRDRKVDSKTVAIKDEKVISVTDERLGLDDSVLGDAEFGFKKAMLNERTRILDGVEDSIYTTGSFIDELFSQTDDSEFNEGDESGVNVVSTSNRQILNLYKTAIVDSISQLNDSYLRVQYSKLLEGGDVAPYLFNFNKASTKIENTSDGVHMRLFFSRKYEVGTDSSDAVIVDIYVDDEGNVIVEKDWQGMCTAHQIFDGYVNRLLEDIWGLGAQRLDHNQNLNMVKKSTLVENTISS